MSLRNLLDPKTKVLTSPQTPQSTRKSILQPDSSPETALTLPSTPSSIHLIFPNPIAHATHIALTFQGGFVGVKAMIYVAMRPKGDSSDIVLGLEMGGRIYPEDKNKRQVFEIPFPPGSKRPPPHHASKIANLPTQMTSQESLGPTIVTEVPSNPNGNGERAEPLVNALTGEELDSPEMVELKIEFEGSSDQFGRVVVYGVEILG